MRHLRIRRNKRNARLSYLITDTDFGALYIKLDSNIKDNLGKDKC